MPTSIKKLMNQLMKMKKYLSVVVLVISLLATLSCDKGKEVGRFSLTDEMKKQIPFKGHETITYQNNVGDIFKFTSGYRIAQEIEQTECISCYDYYVFEEELINFNNGLDQIRYTVHALLDSYLSIRYSIDGHVYYSGFSSPLDPNDLKDSESFIDSISVNNYMYYEVYKDTVSSQESVIPNHYPIYSYYSTTYGIIKIEFSNNTFWELEHVQWFEE